MCKGQKICTVQKQVNRDSKPLLVKLFLFFQFQILIFYPPKLQPTWYSQSIIPTDKYIFQHKRISTITKQLKRIITQPLTINQFRVYPQAVQEALAANQFHFYPHTVKVAPAGVHPDRVMRYVAEIISMKIVSKYIFPFFI